MPFYFACADALLITLKKTDVFSYTIPGKLQSYLACGRPILGAIDGIGNEIISKSNSGYCCSAEDFVSLSKNIIKLSNDSDAKRFDFSRNAISYFEKNFKKEKLILRLEEILKN